MGINGNATVARSTDVPFYHLNIFVHIGPIFSEQKHPLSQTQWFFPCATPEAFLMSLIAESLLAIMCVQRRKLSTTPTFSEFVPVYPAAMLGTIASSSTMWSV